jgi:hypothetical protein
MFAFELPSSSLSLSSIKPSHLGGGAAGKTGLSGKSKTSI